jgi:Cu(I)/Ag(I) efflux system membrane fusion protein
MKSNLVFALCVVAAALAVGGVAHRHASSAQPAAASERKILYYTCPMHPSVRADKPGACPICGMNLVPVYADEIKTNTAALTAAPMSCCGAPDSAGAKP